jgi:hypothetical protein
MGISRHGRYFIFPLALVVLDHQSGDLGKIFPAEGSFQVFYANLVSSPRSPIGLGEFEVFCCKILKPYLRLSPLFF